MRSMTEGALGQAPTLMVKAPSVALRAPPPPSWLRGSHIFGASISAESPYFRHPSESWGPALGGTMVPVLHESWTPAFAGVTELSLFPGVSRPKDVCMP